MSLTDKRVDVPSVERPGVTYHLRMPAVGERSTFKASIIAVGGRAPSKHALLDVMEEGVNAIMAEESDKEDRDRAVAAIQSYRNQMASAVSAYEAAGEEKSEEDNKKFLEAIAAPAEIRQLEAIIQKHYQPYADLNADMAVYPERVGLAAARMFLVGWSGLDEPFSRKLGRVEDQTLEPVGSRDLAAIGEMALQMIQPSKATLGNSPSAAGGSPDQTASSEASTAPQKSRTKAAAGTATS